jgi:hypothetical protein
LPRVVLDPFTGVTPPDANTLNSGQRIYEGAASASLHSVAKAVRDARHQARRAHLYSWANATGFPNTTTTFVEALASISPFPRQRWAGELTRNLDWAAYVSHTGAAGSEVRVRSETQSPEFVTVPTGSSTVAASANGWITGTIEVVSEDTERLIFDGGMRDGARNIVRVDVRRTAGTEARLLAFCLGEAD